ncbi:hypothetical protein CDG76_17320 [Nostoc sp. 'Peltigera membranacea cyanobiont' 210A]|nr:hypothetical protein CDG76_17320 [Nostoc sp. 'Peltigera membranacea cyanobiont' 210A]
MLTIIIINVTFFCKYPIYKKLEFESFMESVNIYKIVEIIAKTILYLRLIILDSYKDKLLMLVVIAAAV